MFLTKQWALGIENYVSNLYGSEYKFKWQNKNKIKMNISV